MSLIFRASFSKLGSGGLSTRLCKVSSSHNVLPVAFMTRDAFLDKVERPSPFPYWKKDITVIRDMFDPMLKRFYENSKLIVVEGPFAVGKSKFAEQLADQFKMLYMPAPTHNDIYINQYGFDLRSLDPKLPPGARSADLPQFLADPKEKGAHFQYHFLQMRYEQYLNALLHILSTGQGVVLNRSFFSDIIFSQAMYSSGYIRKEVLDYFTAIRDALYELLMRPHLVIYLDASVETVKDNIRRRGVPEEVNSKVFTTEYLSMIEKNYKEMYLREISNHSHLLMYEWSKNQDIMPVVEQIEDLDFDSQVDRLGKLGDWIFSYMDELYARRHLYANRTPLIIKFLSTGAPDIPDELLTSGGDLQAYNILLEKEPTEMYPAEFNPVMGDKVLWKRNELSEAYSFRKTVRDFANRDKFMT